MGGLHMSDILHIDYIRDICSVASRAKGTRLSPSILFIVIAWERGCSTTWHYHKSLGNQQSLTSSKDTPPESGHSGTSSVCPGHQEQVTESETQHI